MPDKRPLPVSVVLVVEDDGFVRFTAVLMLEDAGFSVVEAANADEAWDILLARDDVGVLFTDVDMPGSMCGKTLAERVHRSWPDIRLILTSGRQRFSEDEVPDHGLFVAKPYNGPQVVDAIHHAR
ncbi:response regulator [Methylobacterium sp. J-088]|uniref:response regulator n=1 Tax=Methylobacterium sp. J-088 TaxID=2836664 RepID=UPI001FB874D1|nr:response regulator [Methylobacterium sp. J-088]MCJ2065702.1 response regulator [Methylobacterium sp. J-088]